MKTQLHTILWQMRNSYQIIKLGAITEHFLLPILSSHENCGLICKLPRYVHVLLVFLNFLQIFLQSCCCCVSHYRWFETEHEKWLRFLVVSQKICFVYFNFLPEQLYSVLYYHWFIILFNQTSTKYFTFDTIDRYTINIKIMYIIFLYILSIFFSFQHE